MPSAAAGPYVPTRSMGKMLAIVVALLVVTNVITGLAVYYLAVPAPGAGAVQVIGPWAGGEWANFKPVLDAFKNATDIRQDLVIPEAEDTKSEPF